MSALQNFAINECYTIKHKTQIIPPGRCGCSQQHCESLCYATATQTVTCLSYSNVCLPLVIQTSFKQSKHNDDVSCQLCKSICPPLVFFSLVSLDPCINLELQIVHFTVRLHCPVGALSEQVLCLIRNNGRNSDNKRNKHVVKATCRKMIQTNCCSVLYLCETVFSISGNVKVIAVEVIV